MTMKKYKKIYKSDIVNMYEFEELTPKGERVQFDIMKCTNSLWAKAGRTRKELQSYWSLRTYVTSTEGDCYGAYNPQHKPDKEARRTVINFDFMLETTEENRQLLINELARRAFGSDEGAEEITTTIKQTNNDTERKSNA